MLHIYCYRIKVLFIKLVIETSDFLGGVWRKYFQSDMGV